jgi:hypothetical protein
LVNYDNETTITTSPKDVVKISILERRKYAIDAFEFYINKKALNVNPSIAIIKSRMFSFFLEIGASYKRDKKEEYDKVIMLLQSADYAKLITAFNILNEYLDAKGVTKIDTIKQYDSTNTEIENYEKGI